GLEHRFLVSPRDGKIFDRAQRLYVRPQDSAIHSRFILIPSRAARSSFVVALPARLRSPGILLANNRRAHRFADFLFRYQSEREHQLGLRFRRTTADDPASASFCLALDARLSARDLFADAFSPGENFYADVDVEFLNACANP